MLATSCVPANLHSTPRGRGTAANSDTPAVLTALTSVQGRLSETAIHGGHSFAVGPPQLLTCGPRTLVPQGEQSEATDYLSRNMLFLDKGEGGNHMMWGTGYASGGWAMTVATIVATAIIIAVLVLGALWLARSQRTASIAESSLSSGAILDTRFARGEITEAELTRRRRMLAHKSTGAGAQGLNRRRRWAAHLAKSPSDAGAIHSAPGGGRCPNATTTSRPSSTCSAPRQTPNRFCRALPRLRGNRERADDRDGSVIRGPDRGV